MLCSLLLYSRVSKPHICLYPFFLGFTSRLGHHRLLSRVRCALQQILVVVVIVQSLSHVQLFATPWTAACQASLSSVSPGVCSDLCALSWWHHPAISSSVMPISSCPQSFPASGSFPKSWFFATGGQSIEASASASVLPVNIQGWFPLGLTGWPPCSPRDSQASSPAPQFESINSLTLSLFYEPILTSVHDYWKKP